jgi:hypothetical protein
LFDAILYDRKGKVIINLNGDKHTYSFLSASRFASPLALEEEEEEEVGRLCFVKTFRDPLQRAIENQPNDQRDEELAEQRKDLNLKMETWSRRNSKTSKKLNPKNDMYRR